MFFNYVIIKYDYTTNNFMNRFVIKKIEEYKKYRIINDLLDASEELFHFKLQVTRC